jgi:hypothetical protein
MFNGESGYCGQDLAAQARQIGGTCAQIVKDHMELLYVIIAWPDLSPEERQAILDRCKP